MSNVRSFCRLTVFFLRVYPVLPHNRENILFSCRLNPCVFALAVELGTVSGSEGGRREGDRKGTRRGESNNRAAWNLVMYTSPLVPWLIPVTGLLSKKGKKGLLPRKDAACGCLSLRGGLSFHALVGCITISSQPCRAHGHKLQPPPSFPPRATLLPNGFSHVISPSRCTSTTSRRTRSTTSGSRRAPGRKWGSVSCTTASSPRPSGFCCSRVSEGWDECFQPHLT